MKHPILLLLTLLLTACAGYKTPTMSSDPAKMSSDTLCYRYGIGRADNAALAAEITARNLDCAAILRADPLYSGSNESS